MELYKNKNNEIFAFNELQIKQGYVVGYTELTPEEVEEHLNPTPTPAEIAAARRAEAFAVLQSLDNQSIRTLRAVVAAIIVGRAPEREDEKRLVEVEKLAAAERMKVKQGE